MASTATELLDQVRVMRGANGRLSVFRRFLVSINEQGPGGNSSITQELAPYAPGVPQLGSSEDLSDATKFQLNPQFGVFPGTTVVFMVGFTTEPHGPNHVIVTCEFDNFTIAKRKTILTSVVAEEWPIAMAVPYGADVSGGGVAPRYIWEWQQRRTPTARTIMQVHMKVKTLTQVLIDSAASQAGKIHQFSESFSSSESGRYWMFEGLHAVEQSDPKSDPAGNSTFDMMYQWHNDPGFHLPDESVMLDRPLFAPPPAGSGTGTRGGPYAPTFAVLPHRFAKARPDLYTREEIANVSPSDAAFYRWRRPFEQYQKIPQVQIAGLPGQSDDPNKSRPDILIMPRVNEDLLGWVNLPGKPLG